MNETGKTALVTGASSGIGRELANLFAKDGYNLVLVARSGDTLQQVAEEFERQYGIETTVISKDLTQPNAADEIYEQTSAQGLQVDVLVNNAGVGEYGMFANESDLQKELAIIQLNVKSLVHLTKLYLRDMMPRNEGKILMLGSIASVMPNPMMAVYAATKAFVYSFSEALHNELKDTDITVTVLMPPATDTDFFNKAGATHTVAQEQARSMNPADVAQAGYDALMSGKDKVAAGLKTKVMAAASHFMPDQMVTQNARNLMKSQEEANEENKTSTLVLALGVTALVIGGILLASSGRRNGRFRNINLNGNGWNAGRFNRKTRSVTDSVENAVDSVVDSLKGSYYNAKAAVEDALA
ncbi:SDR family NAD(P)-dependent oxidoreductase [Tellurirhabdus rosea]|uniref:SDR family NAD(P)-dependent oxidoreductase n=1 Tax=Tellurirhabdus rosea TaxID=2674997 RepID=UPI00224DD9CD|nr:SDR family oxidoreductase [Tellurirhabdus rosea]